MHNSASWSRVSLHRVYILRTATLHAIASKILAFASAVGAPELAGAVMSSAFVGPKLARVAISIAPTAPTQVPAGSRRSGSLKFARLGISTALTAPGQAERIVPALWRYRSGSGSHFDHSGATRASPSGHFGRSGNTGACSSSKFEHHTECTQTCGWGDWMVVETRSRER